MTNLTHEHPAVLADVDFVALKQVATAERAAAIKAMGRSIAEWLQGGVRLRYSDDALTHPSAGALCGC